MKRRKSNTRVVTFSPASYIAGANQRGADLLVAEREILQKNGGAVVKSSPGKRSGGRVEVPAEEGVTAGPYTAEGIPAAGYGGERDMGFNKNGLTVTETQNPLGRLLGDDATDGSGAVADGKG